MAAGRFARLRRLADAIPAPLRPDQLTD